MRTLFTAIATFAALSGCGFGSDGSSDSGGGGGGGVHSECYQHGFDDCEDGYEPNPSYWQCDEEDDVDAYVDGYCACGDGCD